MTETKLYHYTTRYNLSKIIESGAIIASPGFNEWEKKGVWLSLNTNLEYSASAIAKTREGLKKRKPSEIEEIVTCRIEINTSKLTIFDVNQFKKISRVSNKHFKMLNKFALECGSDISEWRVVFGNIKKELWNNIEVFNHVSQKWEKFIPKKRNLKLLGSLLNEAKQLISFMSKQQKITLSMYLDKMLSKKF